MRAPGAPANKRFSGYLIRRPRGAPEVPRVLRLLRIRLQVNAYMQRQVDGFQGSPDLPEPRLHAGGASPRRGRLAR